MAAKGKNIVHKRLIRSYLTSVISISLVLVLVAASSVFAVNAGSVARWFKENMAVSVLLKQSTSEKEGRALAASLAERPYVKESRFISKEEGALPGALFCFRFFMQFIYAVLFSPGSLRSLPDSL